MATATKFTFQTFDDDASRKDERLARILHGTLAENADELSRLNGLGAGVFVAVQETDFKGRSKGNVKRIRASFTDLDGALLEPVQSFKKPPHIVVETSPRKWHSYWLRRDFPVDHFKPVQKAIAFKFNGDDSVSDLPRAMRLPEFIHHKVDRDGTGQEPFMTRVVKIRKHKPYGLEDLSFGVVPHNLTSRKLNGRAIPFRPCRPWKIPWLQPCRRTPRHPYP